MKKESDLYSADLQQKHSNLLFILNMISDKFFFCSLKALSQIELTAVPNRATSK